MTSSARLRIWVLLAACGAAGSLTAQAPAPTLRIASPEEEAYVTGPVRLVARIDPPSQQRNVRQVVFFADGRQVCTVVRTPFDCDWDAGDGIQEHHIRAVALMRDGTRLVQTVRTRGLQHVEVSNVDVIQITAVVTDGNGKFVRNLKRGDFRIYENGKRQEVSHFAAENIPLELVAAVDISSSMTDALPGVKLAAKQFLSGLQPEDQVTLLGFNENIFTLARRSIDPPVRERAVDRLEPWGGTALYDVIVKAIDVLGRQAGRRSVVLFSDGDDQSSHASLETAIARTEGSDATIYAIGQGRAVRSSDLQKLMRRLAAVSGGRAFFSDRPETLATIFQEILEDLRSQYLLSYAPPDTARDGAWHEIRVEVAGGHHVRARQGYRIGRRR